MNIVKVLGGLGNQLFQYAFGQVVQRHIGETVGYDLSWFCSPTIPPRPYNLDKFNIEVPLAVSVVNNLCRETDPFDQTVLNTKRITYSGYWQRPELFNSDLTEWLREHFHIRKEFCTESFLQLQNEIESCNSVAVHIRRGDYLDHPRHLVLPLSYYQKALTYMSALKKNVVIYIFSDDLEWCKETFHDCHYIDINDYLSFDLMRSCKHFIISNSTFSWWPAFLSINSTIIAPNQWARDRRNGALLHERRVLIHDWMQISLS